MYAGKALLFVGILAVVGVFSVTLIPQETIGQALRVITPPQGGTGIGSATAGDVGKYLRVLDDSPFTYEFASVSGSGSGGSDVNWTWNTSQNVLDSDGASTTATTSVKSNAFFATSTTIASNFRLLTATSATTTNFQTTQFGVGSDYITDLTGTGLSIVSGALTATNDHVAVTVSGARDYITLSGQDIVRGVVDVSDDTNLSADGTEIVLTGDALSLGTALTFTSATATNLASTLSTTSVFYGAGLTSCNGASNALIYDPSTGKFGCNSIVSGSGVSDWNQSLGSYLTPSTTVGIRVAASSTIGDGTATGGLTVAGGLTTTANFNFGNNFNTLQAGITNTNYINASTTGRAGLILTNTGFGTEPEYRFIVGDPRQTLEYLAFGLSNADSVSPATISGIPKNDLAYILSNSGRHVLLSAGNATGSNLYLNAGSTAVPPEIMIDGGTRFVGIGLGSTSTGPTQLLQVNGNIATANLFATGTASSTYASTSRMSLWGSLFDGTGSAGTNGMVLQTNGSGVTWVATSTLGLGGAGGGTVTSVDMTVPTGFTVTGNPVTTSGTLGLTYTAGYEGFLTASGTNWNTFYNTPSNRITDGTGLTWSSNTLNCDTASGSVQGCLTSTDWTTFNQKVSSTSIDTSSELANLITDETGSGSLVFGTSPLFGGTLSFNNATSAGSSTIANLTVTNGTTTNASSTNLFATNASTSVLTVGNTLRLFGGSVTTNNALCIQLTGDAGLCDGNDATGGGSSATGTTLVCASGCPYSSIQTALDAGVRNIELKEETYAGPVRIKFSDTKITGAGATSTIITCDAAVNSPCVAMATTTRLTRIILRDFTIDNTNVTFLGTGLDTSDTSKVYASNIRSQEFNIAHLHQDTTNSSFYSNFENMDYYASSSCFRTGGTKSNMNTMNTARCIFTAPTGIGFGFYDAEGWLMTNVDSEPGSLIGTGAYVDGTSIAITFVNPWMEGNATGTEIRAGALNTSLKGGRITAGTVGIYDGGTNTFLDSTLISNNTTNHTCPTTCLGTYVNTSSSYSTPHVLVGTTTQNSSFTRLGLNISTSDATANMLVLNNAGAFATAPAGIQFTHSSGGFTSGTARIYANPGSGYTNAQLNFAVADSAKALQDRMVIDVDGDVGVGSTTPGHRLTVQGGNAYIGGNLTATGTVAFTSMSTGCLQSTGGVITSTGSSCGGSGAPGGSDEQLQYNNGGAFAGASQLVWDDETGRMGLGSTTPAAFFSIASSTYNYSIPLFEVATSSDPSGQVFSLFATTSTQMASSSTGGLFSLQGARSVFGSLNINSSGSSLLPLETINLNGTVNTGEWVENSCNAYSGSLTAASLTADTLDVCGDWMFQEDADATLQSGLTQNDGVPTMNLLIAATALNGGSVSLFPGTTNNFSIASATPIFETVARMTTPGTSSSSVHYIGFTSTAPNATTYEAFPGGCFFVSSSTQANWNAYCGDVAGAGTFIDTGVASVTSQTANASQFYKFKIIGSADKTYFYITTRANGERLVATIPTVNQTTALYPGLFIAQIQGGASTRGFEFKNLKVKWRIGL